MTHTALPHAFERVSDWSRAWRESGSIVVLLDFDGTLAPIVEHADEARMPPATRETLEHLAARHDTHVAIVSGRGLDDVRIRARVQAPGVAYAGNHGMEIEGAGLHRVHPGAVAARPRLEAVITRVQPRLAAIPGAFLEDKGLTLSIHYRRVERDMVEQVRAAVDDAANEFDELRITEGKEVLEVRPAVDWHKGRAVTFLVESIRVARGAPILYLGDDTTDEDGFIAVRGLPGGEGVVVADPPPHETAAVGYLRTTEEVGKLLDLLVKAAPNEGAAMS